MNDICNFFLKIDDTPDVFMEEKSQNIPSKPQIKKNRPYSDLNSESSFSPAVECRTKPNEAVNFKNSLISER